MESALDTTAVAVVHACMHAFTVSMELQIVLLLVSALRHSLSTAVASRSRDAHTDSGDASAPQSPSEEPPAPVFTRLLHAAAASPALCRRWENTELHSLAFQTLSCCAALSAEHATTLLQVRAAACLPACK